jgi:hypothetical protein
MNHDQIYAVITGDIVGSTKLSVESRDFSLSSIESIFKYVRSTHGDINAHHVIYRGDSFQAVISIPGIALEVSVMIRSTLRAFKNQLDARIAVGLGTIDYRHGKTISEWDGEAFRRSGPVLDEMKGDRRLQISTPWKDVDAELRIELALLDLIIRKWSRPQSEAIRLQLQGYTQERMAKELGISQPAIQQRLSSAGAPSLTDMIQRYQTLIEINIRP